MKKKKIIHILALLITLLLTFTSFTGCGFITGIEQAEKLDLGTHKIHKEKNGKISSDCFVPKGRTACAGGKDCTASVFPSAYVPNIDKTQLYGKDNFNVSAFHVAGHAIVAMNGGGSSACPEDCPIKGANLNFVEKAYSIGLTTGSQLAAKIGLDGIAMSILVAVWACNFLMLVVQERFTMEAVLKGLCQLILGAFVVQQAQGIVQAFMGLIGSSGSAIETSAFAADLQALLDENPNVATISFNMPFVNRNLFVLGAWFDTPAVEALLIGILPARVSLKCATSVFSAVTLAQFEFQLRIKAAPIMFAMTSQTGWGQSQIGYIKQCMGAAAQVAMIGAIMAASKDFTLGISGNIFMNAIGQSLSFMIAGGLVGQVGNITHQVFAH